MILKVETTAASPAVSRLLRLPHLLWYDLSFSLAGVVWVFGRLNKSRERRRRVNLRLSILGLLLGSLIAYGGGSGGGSAGRGGNGAGHPGTPPGNYTVTVTGTIASVTRTVEAVLTVE